MTKIRPFKALIPKLKMLAFSDSFFLQVKEQFPTFRKVGFFKEKNKEAIYVYRQTKGTNSHTGVIAVTDIRDYLNGTILPHEQTLAAKEEKMRILFKERQAQIKPVMLTYPAVNDIENLIKSIADNNDPSTLIQFNDETHCFWAIKDIGSQNKLLNLFKEKVPKTYIADGHHRASTVAKRYLRIKESGNLKPQDSDMLSVFFSSQELQILDFNRVVYENNGLSPLAIIARISQVCDISLESGPYKPLSPHTLGMCINQEWYKLTWRKEVLQKSKKLNDQLDVSLLNKEVISGIFGIEDVRSDQRVKYIEGDKGLNVLQTKTSGYKGGIAFSLFPVDLKTFFQIADNKMELPPKSTYFVPRVRNGFMAYANLED